MGKNPIKRVIAASYSDGLARKFGRLNRAKLEKYGPDLFGVELSQIIASQNNWDIAENLNRAPANNTIQSIQQACMRNPLKPEMGRIPFAFSWKIANSHNCFLHSGDLGTAGNK